MALLMVLAGCCANSVCNCQDERADALTLQFRVRDKAAPAADTTDFAPADVDTVYLLRFALPLPVGPITSRVRRDSVALVRPLATVANPFVIRPDAPFAPGQRLNAFAYNVLVRLPRTARNRRRRLLTYALRNIELRGEFEGTGCCTCYRNTYKALTLNGTKFDRTETDGRPVPLELTR